MSSPPYRLHLTGRIELLDPAGRSIPLRTRKTAQVLAMLALADRPYRRVELAEAVWDRADAKAAREGLRTALSSLRKLLPTNAIVAREGEIALRTGIVEPILDEGDFMPGCDTDWAIDQRLALRTRSLETSLALARAAQTRNDLERSLAHTQAALRIDPLDAAAATLQIELLKARGHAAAALDAENLFRVRSVRELGVVPSLSENSAATSGHPLVAAAEWMLERDPDQACEMLAGTQDQWLVVSLDRALEIHRRTLAVARPGTREHWIVKARTLYLTALAGHLGNRLEEVGGYLQEAAEREEYRTAALLAETLAYAHLSRGEFQRALSFAQRQVAVTALRNDPAALAQAELAYAIVEDQSGRHESGYRRIERAVRTLNEIGSPIQVMHGQNVHAATLIFQGRYERAAVELEALKRSMKLLRSDRMEVWALHSESFLREKTGDISGALALIQRMIEKANGGGQCAVALACDTLMRLHCKVREFDCAADDYARVTLYRRRHGSVPSRLERSLRGPWVQTLSEKLTQADLNAAFRRVALSAH